MTKKGLPKSFKWEGESIEWARNYLKSKVENRDINQKIVSLIRGYSPLENLSYLQFEELILSLNEAGDSGTLFINSMSATWRAKKARKGKKHYNLSLEPQTYSKLKSLASKSSIPNASIKQTLTDLINDIYKTKVEASKKKKSKEKYDHGIAPVPASQLQDQITLLKKEIEALKNGDESTER